MIDSECEDIKDAITKLRIGIASLNHGGYKPLKESFNIVNQHFLQLFETLFNGGEARLRMI